MKTDRKYLDKVLTRLEQYYSNINEPRPEDSCVNDVPNQIDDKEFKTTVPLEDKEICDPVIKTKKGKNVFVDPVPPEDNKIIDIEVLDKKGNEIEDWEDINDLDKSEPEETVTDLDESILFEQEDEDENEMGKLAQDNMGEQNPATGQNPNIDPSMQNPDPAAMMGQDPNAMGMGAGMGQDPNMMGMGAGNFPEERLSAENVGKVFELKKIYSRLLSIETQLSFSSDIILLKLRKFISKAIELFETVISNIGAYRKDIDEIIVMYYEFLERVYSILKRYYNIKEKEEKEKNKNK